jgi:hypothetical protein
MRTEIGQARLCTVTHQKYPCADPNTKLARALSHLATHTTCLHVARSVERSVEVQAKSLICHLFKDRESAPNFKLVFQSRSSLLSLNAPHPPSEIPLKDGTYIKQRQICPVLAGNQYSNFTRRSSFIKKLAFSPKLSMKTWLKLAPL